MLNCENFGDSSRVHNRDRIEPMPGAAALAPLLDDNSGLLWAVEDFTVQAFVAELASYSTAAIGIETWAPRCFLAIGCVSAARTSRQVRIVATRHSAAPAANSVA